MGQQVQGQGTREHKTGDMATEDSGWDEGARKDRWGRNMELGIGIWGGG